MASGYQVHKILTITMTGIHIDTNKESPVPRFVEMEILKESFVKTWAIIGVIGAFGEGCLVREKIVSKALFIHKIFRYAT